MLVFVVRRVVQGAATLVLLALAAFVAISWTPGGPAAFLNGPDQLNEAREQAIIRSLGLDQTIVVQIVRWFGAVARGDLGYSYFHRQATMDVIAGRIPATVELALVCFAVSMVGGVVLGTLAAYRPGRLLDRAIRASSLVVLALPSVWLGLLLIVVFAATLDWLPSAGQKTIGGDGGFIDHLRHLILPVVTLSSGYIATVALSVREVVAPILRSDYIRTARAKGLHEQRVVFVHVLRNAAIPVISLAGLMLPDLLGGSVVVETVFAWPGVGQLTADSVARRDYPVLLAMSLIIAATVLLSSLVADILYRFADPRVGYD